MPSDRAGFWPAGPVLIRASTWPADRDQAAPPDLSDPAALIQDGLAWLVAQWSQLDIRDALTMASPALAARVDQMLEGGAGSVDRKAARRAVTATATYLLRWSNRTTPFGLFAAVGAVEIGPAAAIIGTSHRAVARADAEWLAILVNELEQNHGLRRRLMVVADNAATVRDGRLIVDARPQPGSRTPGPLRDNSTAYSAAVRLVLAFASVPIRFDQLAASLAEKVPHIDAARIEALLHGLIDGGFLITSLRAPMTVIDGLAHLEQALAQAGTADLPGFSQTCERLSAINTGLAHHNTLTDPRQASAARQSISVTMLQLVPDLGPQLAVDLRLDGKVHLPRHVLDEVARTADVLLRIGTRPFGSMAWLEYHARFRDRYGPGALVPVQELVADSGLGYPAGYLGAPKARPAWRTITDRDVFLMSLIQQANVTGSDEIALSDNDIDALAVGDHDTMVPPARVELGFAVHAYDIQALSRSEYTVQVTGAPRTPTSMAGRFAYLLDAAERQQFARTFIAHGDKQATVAQVSFRPRRVHNENVVRVGRLAPSVVSLSEHPEGHVIGVAELAVTCDAEQMYLVHVPTGRRVIPYLPHALDTVAQTPPLARFLAEVADARSAIFGPLDYGAAARNLRYVPRFRHGRAILAPARWLVTADEIPSSEAETWEASLKEWRQRWRVPARVVLCQSELRLPLDLDEPFGRALLRTELGRSDQLELREDLSAGHDWIGCPAEFFVSLTRTVPPARSLPATACVGRALHPADSSLVHARFSGNPARFDQLITAHLLPLAGGLAELGVQHWWINRRRDTIRAEGEQSISLVLRLIGEAAYGPVAAKLGHLASGLRAQGLPCDIAFVSHFEHPGRYGHGPALFAAEQVFAADTVAAVCQLRLAEHTEISGQALAAASMANLAGAFGPATDAGYRALLDCLQHVTEPAAREVNQMARQLANPAGNHRVLRALPYGDAVAEAWNVRGLALRTYHDLLLAQREPFTVLRTLLHEHHVRALGVDPQFERATNHAARAAAQLCISRAGAQ